MRGGEEHTPEPGRQDIRAGGAFGLGVFETRGEACGKRARRSRAGAARAQCPLDRQLQATTDRFDSGSSGILLDSPASLFNSLRNLADEVQHHAEFGASFERCG